MEDQEGIYDDVPLADQRRFPGLRHAPVQFVPASTTPEQPSEKPLTSAQKYLAIAFGDGAKDMDIWAKVSPDKQLTFCDQCQASYSDPSHLHINSIAHQLNREQSHGPSHLDRKGIGFGLLEKQGWDADARKGLGAEGNEGRLHPIEAVANPTRTGLGVKVDNNTAKKEVKSIKTDAGAVRKRALEDKKKGEKLRNLFYGNGEVEKHLGQQGNFGSLDMSEFFNGPEEMRKKKKE
jgi:hypothetical protein